jgi:hypothetical protein
MPTHAANQNAVGGFYLMAPIVNLVITYDKTLEVTSSLNEEKLTVSLGQHS